MSKSIRTTEQILADLNSQFPKTTTVEEGKQTMARNTKAAAKPQEAKAPRSVLQQHQNRKLSSKEFSEMLVAAFGEQQATLLAKKFVKLAVHLRGKVPSEHYVYDFRGGWGKAANVRVFIPQDWSGVGVWVRVSLDVVDGIWNADSAKIYDKPHTFQGPDLTEFKRAPAEKIQNSSISGQTAFGSGSVRSLDLVETERSGVEYVLVDVLVGTLGKGDVVSIIDPEGNNAGQADVMNIFNVDPVTCLSVEVVEVVQAGQLASVQFDWDVERGTLCGGYRFRVTRAGARVATKEEVQAVETPPKKPEEAAKGLARSFADLGRTVGRRSLHVRPATQEVGVADVEDIYSSPKGPVYGVRVMEGTVRVGDRFQIYRAGKAHVNGTINGIRQYQNDVNEVGCAGEYRDCACGLLVSLDGVTDLKVGDKLYVAERIEFKTILDDVQFSEDARGKIAKIELLGVPMLRVGEMVKAALMAQGVTIPNIANAARAVHELLEMVRGSNIGEKATRLVLKVLHQDEFYPPALVASMVYSETNLEVGVGTVHILDGEARRPKYFGVGGLYIDTPLLATHHGLTAFYILASYLDGMDERDRADFEHAYLETHRLGLAEAVKLTQQSANVLEISVTKSKYHASGYVVASLKFDDNGMRSFRFYGVNEDANATAATEPKSPTEISVVVSESDRFVIQGPIDSNYVEVIRQHIGEHNEEYIHFFTTGLAEVKRIATEALIDNIDHWKDDQIVPWKAVMRFSQGSKSCYGKVALVCMDAKPEAGFSLDLKFDGNVAISSPVYGFGRYSNLALIQGIAMHRLLGASVIAAHLLDDEPEASRKLINAISPQGEDEGNIVLAQDPERNVMVVIHHGKTADKDDVLVELNLVNGRIASWTIPKARQRAAAKPQPQPHRHHHMDAEHSASSIVPRPDTYANLNNLTAYQAQATLSVLVEAEEEVQKFKLLSEFIANIYKNATNGGTGDALLYSIHKQDNVVKVLVQYLDTAGFAQPIAEMAVHF